MRRGALLGLMLLATLLSPVTTASAASEVQLKHAPDGSVLVVGSGWHRGQQLVISLGARRFSVRADGSGDFELATGLSAYSGAVGVHHRDVGALAFVPLQSLSPNPLAVLFAWSVAEGGALLALLLGVGLVAAGIVRRWRSGRYPAR